MDASDRPISFQNIPQWAQQHIVDWYKKNPETLRMKRIFTLGVMVGGDDIAKGTPHEDVVELMRQYGSRASEQTHEEKRASLLKLLDDAKVGRAYFAAIVIAACWWTGERLPEFAAIEKSLRATDEFGWQKGLRAWNCLQRFPKILADIKGSYQHVEDLVIKNFDPLTSLANRRLLAETFPPNDSGALLLLDINGFKYLNDRYGCPPGIAPSPNLVVGSSN